MAIEVDGTLPPAVDSVDSVQPEEDVEMVKGSTEHFENKESIEEVSKVPLTIDREKASCAQRSLV